MLSTERRPRGELSSPFFYKYFYTKGFKMSHCKNCGHPSHCGVPLYSENHFSLKNELPDRIKLCDCCVCTECAEDCALSSTSNGKCAEDCTKMCHICKEHKDCNLFDYRDARDRLRGQVYICQDCANEPKENQSGV